MVLSCFTSAFLSVDVTFKVLTTFWCPIFWSLLFIGLLYSLTTEHLDLSSIQQSLFIPCSLNMRPVGGLHMKLWSSLQVDCSKLSCLFSGLRILLTLELHLKEQPWSDPWERGQADLASQTDSFHPDRMYLTTISVPVANVVRWRKGRISMAGVLLEVAGEPWFSGGHRWLYFWECRKKHY